MNLVWKFDVYVFCYRVERAWDLESKDLYFVFCLSLHLSMFIAISSQTTATSLDVPWLGLSIREARGSGSIPSRGTGSQVPQQRVCMPQLKILRATMNVKDCVPQLKPSTAK